jgi:hypothetical protein
VHFREILSGYFLFSRFDWSIFVTQLVAKHMKEILIVKNHDLLNSRDAWRLTLSGLFICQFSAFAVWRYFAGAEIGAKR